VTSATERCLRCRRPVVQCLCDVLRPVATGVQVTVVQHPAEARHAFNTAGRMAKMLTGAEVALARPDGGGRLVAEASLASDAVLLFPREDAVPASAWRGPPPSQLVVVDGTWSQAKRLIVDNPWLRALPCVSLREGAPSNYRIREEPAAHCLSTVEAVYRVLRAWEPANGELDALLVMFEALVDRHLAAERPARARHRRRSRATVWEQLQAWDDVVLVYAEEVGRQGGDPRLLQWAAVRPASGEVFDQTVVLRGVNPCVRASTGLPEAADGTLRQLVSAWRRWRRPDDQLFAWTATTRSVARRAELATGVHGLKALVGRVQGRARGRLDELVGREGLVAEPVLVRGRAAERLGNAVALARWLAVRR